MIGGFPFIAQTVSASVTKSPVQFVSFIRVTAYSSSIGATSGQQSGDVGLAFGFRPATGAPGTPSGATLIDAADNGGALPYLNVSRKTIADGTTNSGTYTNTVVYSVFATFRNATYATGDAVSGGTITTVTVPAISGSFETNSMAAIYLSTRNTTTVLSSAVAAAFPDWTIRGSDQSGQGTGYVLATRLVGGSGFAGGSFTVASTTGWSAAVVILEPTA